MNLSEYERGYRDGKRDTARVWREAWSFHDAMMLQEARDRRVIKALLAVLCVGIALLVVGVWT